MRVKPRALARWTARLDLPTLGAPDITTTASASFPSSKGYQSADVTLPASSSTVLTWLCQGQRSRKIPRKLLWSIMSHMDFSGAEETLRLSFPLPLCQVASRLEAYLDTCRLDESIKVAVSLKTYDSWQNDAAGPKKPKLMWLLQSKH